MAIGCWRASRRNVRSSIVCVSSSITSSALDDVFGGVEVAVEQRLRAARDRFGGERGETDDVDAQLVEALVERLARLVVGTRRAVEWWSRRLRLMRPRRDLVAAAGACPLHPRTWQLFTARLPARHIEGNGVRNSPPVVLTVNRERLRIPPPRAVPGSGSSRLGVRGREELDGECGAGKSPLPGPHTLRRLALRQVQRRERSSAEPRAAGALAGGDAVHLFGDGHRVVADALVVTRDQRELHRAR